MAAPSPILLLPFWTIDSWSSYWSVLSVRILNIGVSPIILLCPLCFPFYFLSPDDFINYHVFTFLLNRDYNHLGDQTTQQEVVASQQNFYACITAWTISPSTFMQKWSSTKPWILWEKRFRTTAQYNKDLKCIVTIFDPSSELNLTDYLLYHITT